MTEITSYERCREPIFRSNIFIGLCLACRRAVTCTFPRTLTEPVHCCEEFEGFEPAGVKVGLSRPQKEAQLVRAGVGEPQGLCHSCELRETCTYPRPAGGVWRCEEYR